MALLSAFGQASDTLRPNRSVEELKQSLTSGQPREVAWAAYDVAHQNRRELVPDLILLISSYQRGSVQNAIVVPPEDAAIEAVADALIQLQAKVPSNAAMRLYPKFPAPAVILLSRASDNTAPLLEILQSARWRDLWLAAGNLLAVHPPPEFVRSLLDRLIVTFRFRVVAPSDKTEVERIGSGCETDFAEAHVEAFRDWPKARLYGLDTDAHAQNIFARGIHPVGFFSWETTDYVDHSGPNGSCSPEKSIDWRTGLLAQLRGNDMSGFPLKAEIEKTLRYASPASFDGRAKALVRGQSLAFESVVESFVESGLLSVQDSKQLHLECRIEIQDDRPLPRRELPSIEGKWCNAPSPEAPVPSEAAVPKPL